MAETIRDVVVRIAIEQAKSEVKVDTKKAQKDIKDYGTSTNKALKAIEHEMEHLQSASEIAGKGMIANWPKPKQLYAIEESLRHIKEQSVLTAEGFRLTGEGMMKTARGATLLGITADDDLAKVVEQLARIQGGMDIFAGLLDTYKGITQATRSMAAAQEAQAVIAAQGAAANTALAGGITAVSAATKGLLAVGAIALLATAFMAYKGSIASANKELEEFLDRQKKIKEEAKKAAVGLRERKRQGKTASERLEDVNRQQADRSELQGRQLTRADRSEMHMASNPRLYGVGTFQEESLLPEQFQRTHQVGTPDPTIVEGAELRGRLDAGGRYEATDETKRERAEAKRDLEELGAGQDSLSDYLDSEAERVEKDLELVKEKASIEKELIEEEKRRISELVIAEDQKKRQLDELDAKSKVVHDLMLRDKDALLDLLTVINEERKEALLIEDKKP